MIACNIIFEFIYAAPPLFGIKCSFTGIPYFLQLQFILYHLRIIMNIMYCYPNILIFDYNKVK